MVDALKCFRWRLSFSEGMQSNGHTSVVNWMGHAQLEMLVIGTAPSNHFLILLGETR